MPDFDIVVNDPDSPQARLIVETKLSDTNLPAAEKQLKRAMLRISCPVGLVVTPQTMVVFSDRYLSQSEDSIDTVGRFEVRDLLPFERKAGITAQDERRFGEAVQQWLENLPSSLSQAQQSGERWKVLKTYVIPAVETGIVRSAAPRYW